MQPVPITTGVGSYSPVHCEMYSIQQYVIKFVRDLGEVGGFLRETPVSSTNKTDRHDIAEILLKNLSWLLLMFSSLQIYTCYHCYMLKCSSHIPVFVWFMVFNATFNNISAISCRSVLLVEETGVSRRKPPTSPKSLTNFITYCCI
jgi:hypothetical protein